MNTQAPARPATQPMKDFLNKLRVERGYAPIHPDDFGDFATTSRAIDQFKAMPRANARRPERGYLSDIPNSKYSVLEGGTRTFWEVKEFKGTRYIRLLVGAPGAFQRVRVGFDRARFVADLIRVDALAAAQAFAAHYTCCAVCGAELSDETSVALGLGPVCRGRFGL